MARIFNLIVVILELISYSKSLKDRQFLKDFVFYTQISNFLTLISSLALFAVVSIISAAVSYRRPLQTDIKDFGTSRVALIGQVLINALLLCNKNLKSRF